MSGFTLRRPPLPFRHPAVWLSTWFGAGLIQPASGTWGSLAALPFAWGLAWLGGPVLLAAGAAVAFAVGVWAAGIYEAADGAKDPGAIVIDEVAGQWLTLVPFAPDPTIYVLGFVLFRLFDIVKPWPIRWLERRVPGGLGVMADDILAGALALIVLLVIQTYR